jgi:hypothetical protein
MTQALTPLEAKAIRRAVGDAAAGEMYGFSHDLCGALKSGEAKLVAAPAQAVWVPFSRQELDILLDAVSNGAEGVLQPSSGVSADRKRAFRSAANRLIDAGGFTMPRF